MPQYVVEYKVFDAVLVDAFDEREAKDKAADEIYADIEHHDFEIESVMLASKELND